MGDEHHRLVDLAPQPHDLVLHVAADQRIERRERLVEQQDVGIGGQCSGEADALLLPAAELMRAVAAHLRQPDEFECLVGFAAPCRLVDTAHLETEGDVVDQRSVRQQTEVLEHHRHLVAAHVEQRVAVGLGHVDVADSHRADGRLDQPGEATDQASTCRCPTVP